MRMIPKIVVVSVMLVTVAAAASPKVLPKLYRVDGRPVPVSCLEGLASLGSDARKTPIDVLTCGDPKLMPKAQADGSVGYDDPDGRYFYYSYVGKSGGIDVLSLQNSGGGTGRFTQLVGVKHSGHFISWARNYAGGDRCNGGVSAERISNGKLTFDQAITPYDLIDLAQPKKHLEAYKDLEASAASCIGVVHMSGNDMHWTGVSLTVTDWTDSKGWTDKYTYQACFNELYRQTVSSGLTQLDRKGTVNFAQSFVARCVLNH